MEIEIVVQHRDAEIKELEAEIQKLLKIIHEKNLRISELVTRDAVLDARAMCIGRAKKSIQDAVKSLDWGDSA